MIKRYLFLVVIVLNIGIMAYAMELDTKIKLPPAEQLKEYFDQGGLGSFASKTKIHEFLDGKEMSLGLLFNAADTYRDQYLENVRKRYPDMEIRPDLLKKEKILACILSRVSVKGKIDDFNMQHMDPLTRTMHTPINVPDETELKKCLSLVIHDVFVKSTRIHKCLGRHFQLSPIQIAEIVDGCIKGYECPPIDWIDREQRQEILKSILRSPEVYLQLCQYEARLITNSPDECLYDKVTRAKNEQKSKL